MDGLETARFQIKVMKDLRYVARLSDVGLLDLLQESSEDLLRLMHDRRFGASRREREGASLRDTIDALCREFTRRRAVERRGYVLPDNVIEFPWAAWSKPSTT